MTVEEYIGKVQSDKVSQSPVSVGTTSHEAKLHFKISDMLFVPKKPMAGMVALEQSFEDC
jgi:hypothetical protein